MAPKKRVMVFIDGSNHYHIVRDMFKSKQKSMNFDFEKFVNALVGDSNKSLLLFSTIRQGKR